jgi:hypothetical protein
MSFAPLPGKMQGVDSTIKIGLDSSDVDALIEKLERATELAAKLADMWPFLEHRVQATDYSQARRDSDRKFFAEAAAPEGAVTVNINVPLEFATRPPGAKWCSEHGGWHNGPSIPVRSNRGAHAGVRSVCGDCMLSGRLMVIGSVEPLG